jgi:hypothetical protein
MRQWPSVSPKSEPCSIRSRLIEELLAVHRQLASLGEHEVGAVLRGDLDTARARRDAAMEALRAHIADHAC